MFQHVRHFTRCRNEQTRNILDLIITKNENSIDNIEILPSLGCSDHVLLAFEYICDGKTMHSGNERYLYRKCDLTQFAAEWENVEWPGTFENSGIEEVWSSFSQKFNDCIEEYVSKSRSRRTVSLNHSG